MKMVGISHKIVLVSFLLLVVKPCVPEPTDVEQSENVSHNDNTPPGIDEPTLKKHDQENGLNEDTDPKDGLSARFEPSVLIFGLCLWRNLPYCS